MIPLKFVLSFLLSGGVSLPVLPSIQALARVCTQAAVNNCVAAETAEQAGLRASWLGKGQISGILRARCSPHDFWGWPAKPLSGCPWRQACRHVSCCSAGPLLKPCQLRGPQGSQERQDCQHPGPWASTGHLHTEAIPYRAASDCICCDCAEAQW